MTPALLRVTLAATLLAACGGTSPAPAAAKADAPGAAATLPAAAGQTQVPSTDASHSNGLYTGGPNGGVLVASSEPPGPPKPCMGSLEELCRTGCEDFTEAWRSLQRGAAPCRAGERARYSAGTCGSARFIASDGGFSGEVTYYDAAGKVIAASFSTDDAELCGNSFSRWYGKVLKCRAVTTSSLCVHPELDVR